jgi:hypothetical protein
MRDPTETDFYVNTLEILRETSNPKIHADEHQVDPKFSQRQYYSKLSIILILLPSPKSGLVGVPEILTME